MCVATYQDLNPSSLLARSIPEAALNARDYKTAAMKCLGSSSRYQSLAWTAMVGQPAELRHSLCADRPLEPDPVSSFFVLQSEFQWLRTVVELAPVFFGKPLHSFGDIGELRKDIFLFIRIGFHVEER